MRQFEFLDSDGLHGFAERGAVFFKGYGVFLGEDDDLACERVPGRIQAGTALAFFGAGAGQLDWSEFEACFVRIGLGPLVIPSFLLSAANIKMGPVCGPDPVIS